MCSAIRRATLLILASKGSMRRLTTQGASEIDQGIVILFNSWNGRLKVIDCLNGLGEANFLLRIAPCRRTKDDNEAPKNESFHFELLMIGL